MIRSADRCCSPHRSRRRSGACIAFSASLLLLACAGTPESVLTYHYDTWRTGWNNVEATLTTSNVPTHFGLLRTVALDDQVDTQPLIVAGLTTVGGLSTNGHDVVYVTTENDTVYAIDATTGAVLAHNHLATPVSYPQNCTNNGPNVGINGTGVIDQPSNTLFVITYGVESGNPVYRIHALDIATLNDKVSPAPVIGATHTLSDGSTFTFNPAFQRQRAALLETNGNIYAAFGSFCDFTSPPGHESEHFSRGWILGWNQSTLAQLGGSALPDSKGPPNNGVALSSVWMSGSGLAIDPDNNILAVVGNSLAGDANDSSGGTNYSESVIKVPTNLSGIIDHFTPSNVAALDGGDLDFGSGGVLVLPGRWSSTYIATATGKDGNMYVLDPLHLSTGPLDTKTAGYCWCNQSYFFDSNWGPMVVSSAGGNGQGEPAMPDTIQLWSLPSSGPPLVHKASSADLSGTGQDGGFFTSVSGYGPNAIIWAVTRPDNHNNLHLFAFSEAIANGTLTQLFESPGSTAGTWPNTGGNANLVPVVANGQVYVASYKQLAIFGLH